METISITFGDRAENHAGMDIIGNSAERGFTVNELKLIAEKFDNTELVDLSYKDIPAAVLIIRGAIENSDELFTEMKNLPHDKKAKMRGRVVNKRARWNLCFSETASEPDIEKGRGTVVAFNTVPLLNELRQRLINIINDSLGDEFKDINLQGELNYYYDIKKCGIGFHGDSERKIVICARLGATIPLQYQWYHRFKRVGPRFKLTLNNGDIYIMSEKAVGTDWKRSSIYTIRHAAGAAKYLK